MPDSRRSGFSSAAGLIQNYDMEETQAVKLPPWIIMGLGLGVAVLVEVLNWRLI